MKTFDRQRHYDMHYGDGAHVKDLVAQLRFVANPKDNTAFLRFACLLPKVGEKTAIRLLKLANGLAKDMSISVCEALGNEKVLQKVPKDAKEDWESLCETLVEIHKVAANSSPSVVVEEAIGGWGRCRRPWCG